MKRIIYIALCIGVSTVQAFQVTIGQGTAMSPQAVAKQQQVYAKQQQAALKMQQAAQKQQAALNKQIQYQAKQQTKIAALQDKIMKTQSTMPHQSPSIQISPAGIHLITGPVMPPVMNMPSYNLPSSNHMVLPSMHTTITTAQPIGQLVNQKQIVHVPSAPVIGSGMTTTISQINPVVTNLVAMHQQLRANPPIPAPTPKIIPANSPVATKVSQAITSVNTAQQPQELDVSYLMQLQQQQQQEEAATQPVTQPVETSQIAAVQERAPAQKAAPVQTSIQEPLAEDAPAQSDSSDATVTALDDSGSDDTEQSATLAQMSGY